jgi:hypothetical protein
MTWKHLLVAGAIAALLVLVALVLLPKINEPKSLETNATPAPETSRSMKAAHSEVEPATSKTAVPPVDSDIVDPKAFACRTRKADYAFVLEVRAIPAEVLHKLACGHESEAVDLLFPLARKGDLAAFGALVALDGRCKRRLRNDAETSEHQEEQLQELRERDAAPLIVERARELVWARTQDTSQEMLALCGRLTNEIPSLRGDVMSALDQSLGRPIDPAIDGPNLYISVARKLAERGNATEQMRLAAMLMLDGRPDNQAEAMQWLEKAGKSLPEAKAEFAACLVQGCPTPAGDVSRARGLFEEAAKQGSRLALSALAGESVATRRGLVFEMPSEDRYAWKQMYKSLAASGCFGTDAYLEWAMNSTEPADPAATVPDAAARAAERLNADNFDRIRRAMNCSD